MYNYRITINATPSKPEAGNNDCKPSQRLNKNQGSPMTSKVLSIGSAKYWHSFGHQNPLPPPHPQLGHGKSGDVHYFGPSKL